MVTRSSSRGIKSTRYSVHATRARVTVRALGCNGRAGTHPQLARRRSAPSPSERMRRSRSVAAQSTPRTCVAAHPPRSVAQSAARPSHPGAPSRGRWGWTPVRCSGAHTIAPRHCSALTHSTHGLALSIKPGAAKHTQHRARTRTLKMSAPSVIRFSGRASRSSNTTHLGPGYCALHNATIRWAARGYAQTRREIRQQRTWLRMSSSSRRPASLMAAKLMGALARLAMRCIWPSGGRMTARAALVALRRRNRRLSAWLANPCQSSFNHEAAARAWRLQLDTCEACRRACRAECAALGAASRVGGGRRRHTLCIPPLHSTSTAHEERPMVCTLCRLHLALHQHLLYSIPQ